MPTFEQSLQKCCNIPAETRSGAGNGIRTRDTKLGKLVLYQLSYARLGTLKTLKLYLLFDGCQSFFLHCNKIVI